MLKCPKCGASYADGISHCTRDGTPLVQAESEHAASGSTVRPPGTAIGSYRIVQMIGEGGMGRVYLAEHVKLGRRVALKMLRGEYASNAVAVKRFFREARAVNQIQHENIVEITDFIEEEGGDNYYIMELIQGRSLADLLEGESAIPVSRALGIAVQACETLAAVHAAGIVHRDLKPDNIFLTEKGGRKDFVKLLDFGVAKLVDSGEGVPIHETAAGAILGTPEYMSPEQAGGRKVDFRSDIYSFGVIMYEMVCGTKPHRGKSYGELVIQHMTITPTRPSKLKDAPQVIPRALEDLIMRCLAKEPEKRPSDMGEIGAFLRKLSKDESITLERYMPSPGGARRRRVWLATLAGLVLVVALAAGLVLPGILDGQAEATAKDAAATDAGAPDMQPPLDIQLPDLSKVEISLDTRPQGARVFRAGDSEPAGVTPLSLYFERSDGKQVFELKLEGYQPIEHEVPLNEDARFVFDLAEAKEPAAGGKRRKRRRKKKKRRRKKKDGGDTGVEKPPDPGSTIDPFEEGF